MNKVHSIINFKKLFILLVIILNVEDLQAQKLSDSTRSIWINENNSDSLRFKSISNYYYKYTYAQPDSVIAITNYHYALAKSKKSTKEMATALNERSYAYYIKGDLNKSTDILHQSIDLFKTINDPKNLAVIQSNLGNIYLEQKEYLKAFNSFNESLITIRQEKLKTSEARLLAKIGDIYNKLDELDLAMDYYNDSEEICIAREITKKNQIGLIYLKKSEIYFKKELLDLSIEYAEKADEELKKSNNKSNRSECYLLLAKSYNKLGKNKKALNYLDKSLGLTKEINNQSKIIEALILKSYFTLESNPTEAKKQAEKIVKLLKKETSNEIKANLYNLLYTCYKKSKQTGLALSMYEKYNVYKDTVQLEKNKLLIIKETIRNNYENRLINKNIINEKEKAIIRVKYEYRIYTMIALTIFIFILSTYIIRIKNITNRKKLDSLLAKINLLKHQSNVLIDTKKFKLNRKKIELTINKKLNETDWNILLILLENPEATNKEISEQAFLSIDGIGSALRRMYIYFDVKETNYKKVSLIKNAIEICNLSKTI